MLRLLLDQHVSPAIGDAARKQAPAIEVSHVRDHGWLGLSDPELLLLAADRKLTLVTYDLRTIPEHLRDLHERGLDHAGVIFVARHTFAQNAIGGIGRALASLWDHEQGADWTNRTFFLSRTR